MIVYWEEFIPFAHGARLFGKVYNETVNPEDPYEFADLLSGTEMLSLERNRKLEEISEKLRKSPELIKVIKERSQAEEIFPEKENVDDTGIGHEGKTGPADTKGIELEEKPEIKSERKAVNELEEEIDLFISRYGGSYSESPGTKKAFTGYSLR